MLTFMKRDFVEQTNQELLARKLEEHIAQQGLAAGERYLTADSAAEYLGVNRMAADRAMTVLVRRNMLVRRRGRGTFVGPAVGPPKAAVTHVHVIHCAEGEFSAPPIPSDRFLAGLRGVIANAVLHTHLFAYDRAKAMVRELIESFPANDNKRTVVLALSPRGVQEYVARRGLPAVVIGGVFPGVPLANIEADQFEIGRNLVRLARRLGASHFVFINREHWRRGDSRAFDGMVRELAELNLPADRIMIRNFPKDAATAFNVLGAVAAGAVEDSNTGKAALLCRSSAMAEMVAKAAEAGGLHVPDDIFVVHNRHWNDETSVTRPYVAEAISEDEALARIGYMLKNGLEDNPKAITPCKIPVTIVD